MGEPVRVVIRGEKTQRVTEFFKFKIEIGFRWGWCGFQDRRSHHGSRLRGDRGDITRRHRLQLIQLRLHIQNDRGTAVHEVTGHNNESPGRVNFDAQFSPIDVHFYIGFHVGFPVEENVNTITGYRTFDVGSRKHPYDSFSGGFEFSVGETVVDVNHDQPGVRQLFGREPAGGNGVSVGAGTDAFE